MTGPTQTYLTHPKIASQASLKLEKNHLRTDKRQLSFTQWAEATDSLSGRWHRIKTQPKIKTAQVNTWMTEPHGPLKEAGMLWHLRPALSTNRQTAHLAWVALPRHHMGGEGAGVLLNTVWRRGKEAHRTMSQTWEFNSSLYHHSRTLSRLSNLSGAVSSSAK